MTFSHEIHVIDVSVFKRVNLEHSEIHADIFSYKTGRILLHLSVGEIFIY